MIQSTVTFGVSSIGNIRGLCLCLASVLNGQDLPAKIQIRMEGEFPSFSDFYLGQILDLARLRGVEVGIYCFKSTGVRDSYDWHLENCDTEWLWTAGDDVIFDFDCLSYYFKALDLTNVISSLSQSDMARLAYVAGMKVDCDNSRKYPDYDTRVRLVWSNQTVNHFHGKVALSDLLCYCELLDTGNSLLHVPVLKKANVKFALFPDSVNSGGEDTLLAHDCLKKGLLGYACPSAHAIHLEKKEPGFGEINARAEMIKRAKQVLESRYIPK